MKFNKNETVWAMKYRPSTIEDMVLSSENRAFFNKMIDSGNFMSLALTGKPGIGKTTTAKAIVDTLGAEYLFLNGSGRDRGIDTVKNKIIDFAMTASLDGDKKFIIYDEADALTPDAQDALKATIEDVSSNCVFILTANNINKISAPLMSRCHHVDLTVHKNKEILQQMGKRCVGILKNEGVEFEGSAVVDIIKSNFPDFRKTLNSLQEQAMGGKIDSNAASRVQATSNSKFVEILKSKKFKDMHDWVLLNVKDCDYITNIVWDDAFDIFKPESVPYAAVYLSECQDKLTRVSNQNLTLIASLAQIMADCEFNE